MKVLITGAKGYIGDSLARGLSRKYDIYSITRDDLDLLDSQKCKDFFADKRYDVVIHCAVEGGSRLKKDDSTVLDANLKMYYNLLDNKHAYNRFIQFGSGAEVYNPFQPYGMSKQVITSSMRDKPNFFNIRIYGVFDENELDTRFIKSSLLKYINKSPIQIHQNKYMDFFYMKDLITVVDYYIKAENPEFKEYDCSYFKKPTSLKEIAEFINTLGDYQVNIQIDVDGWGNQYISPNMNALNIDKIGLEQGILEVYNKLK